MKNIDFDDYLAKQMKDPMLKAEFAAETARLESAIDQTHSKEKR